MSTVTPRAAKRAHRGAQDQCTTLWLHDRREHVSSFLVHICWARRCPNAGLSMKMETEFLVHVSRLLLWLGVHVGRYNRKHEKYVLRSLQCVHSLDNLKKYLVPRPPTLESFYIVPGVHTAMRSTLVKGNGPYQPKHCAPFRPRFIYLRNKCTRWESGTRHELSSSP